MYPKAELRTLVALSDATTTELAEELGRSTSYTSELVSRLESKGLVTVMGDEVIPSL